MEINEVPQQLRSVQTGANKIDRGRRDWDATEWTLLGTCVHVWLEVKWNELSDKGIGTVWLLAYVTINKYSVIVNWPLLCIKQTKFLLCLSVLVHVLVR